MTLTHALRKAMPDLPKKLALAARYALDHPDRVALSSMRSTATAVGVTSTTMLRLARHLGYEGYEDFKAAFQNELLRDGFSARAGALRQKDGATGGQSHADRILLAAETNIRQLRISLSRHDLDTFRENIRKAPNAFLVGSSSLFWLASMMKNTGGLILPNLRLVGSEYAIAAEHMSALDDDDMVIGFGMRPTAQRTVAAMRFARQRGAFIVAITDRPSSPLAEEANIAFFAGAESPHYYPSVVAMTALVEVLLASVVAGGDGREAERIREFERLREGTDAYFET